MTSRSELEIETCPFCARRVALIPKGPGLGTLRAHTDPKWGVVCEGSHSLSVEWRRKHRRGLKE